MTTPRDPIYAGHRYPAEIISYAIWLYFRFPLSLRMVEEMLAARGISVTHETIRQWGLKFGREFANRIRQRALAVATNGTWMRSSSASPGKSIGSGVPSTRTASFSASWFRTGATRQGAQ
jgi:putative transposase